MEAAEDKAAQESSRGTFDKGLAKLKMGLSMTSGGSKKKSSSNASESGSDKGGKNDVGGKSGSGGGGSGGGDGSSSDKGSKGGSGGGGGGGGAGKSGGKAGQFTLQSAVGHLCALFARATTRSQRAGTTAAMVALFKLEIDNLDIANQVRE